MLSNKNIFLNTSVVKIVYSRSTVTVNCQKAVSVIERKFCLVN